MNLWLGTSHLAMALLGGGAGGDRVAAASATAPPSVTLFDYLGIPAITGAGITLLSFLLSVWLIRRNDSKSEQGMPSWTDWLQRPILGAGAWTSNDSWATNISTGFVVVAAVISATTTTTLFPGVTLDRFSLVNLAAGFFVAAAPVVFGILYARFTTRNPGLTADATVKVPGLRPAAINAPSGASITVAADTTMADGSAHWVTVRGGGSYQIPPGTAIKVLTGVTAAAKTCVDAGRAAFLQAALAAGVPADATGMAADILTLTLAVEKAFVRTVIQADVTGDEQNARRVIVPALRTALDGQEIRDAADTLAAVVGKPHHWPHHGHQAAKIAAAGHSLTEAMKEAVSQISSLTPDGAMAYAGGADIAILPGSTIHLSAPVDSPAGTLTIQASDVLAQAPGSAPEAPRHVHVVPQTPPAPPDAPVTQPLLIDAAGGAKITVTGAADISLPQGAVICAPRRPDYPLPKPRQLLAPQGTNLIVANLRIILTVNILTMFGIGAELGIAGVLAAFSEASTPGLGFITAGLAVIAVVVVLYAGTATRAMADPQPGSSISSQAGASFTL